MPCPPNATWSTTPHRRCRKALGSRSTRTTCAIETTIILKATSATQIDEQQFHFVAPFAVLRSVAYREIGGWGSQHRHDPSGNRRGRLHGAAAPGIADLHIRGGGSSGSGYCSGRDRWISALERETAAGQSVLSASAERIFCTCPSLTEGAFLPK
jgi:hypothetical protein